MNKKLFFKICSVSIGGFLIAWSVAFTFFLMRSYVSEKNQNDMYETKNNQNVVESAKIAHYVAKEENGKVAVYEIYSNGYEKLIGVPNIDMTQLSPNDKSDFSKGIILKTKEELASLMEDFTS